jgi:hypothetical protein
MLCNSGHEGPDVSILANVLRGAKSSLASRLMQGGTVVGNRPVSSS